MRGIAAQFYATIVGNLLALTIGIAFAWPSTNIPLLRSADTPLVSGPLTIHEVSWVSSVLYISGMIGAPFFGILVSKIGRKMALYVIAQLLLVSWILISAGTTVEYLYLARITAGLGAAGSYVVMPLFVSEISNDRVRGALGSIMLVSLNGGIILGFMICGYLDYYVVPYIPIGILVVFCMGFSFVPDSPKYLMVKNMISEAERSSLIFDKAISENKLSIVGQNEHIDVNLFKTGSTRKGILIAFLSLAITCFSGPLTFNNYYGTIFQESGSTLSSDASTIIVGFAQLVGTSSATIFADRFGRKPLLLFSAYGCACCQALMGAYMFLLSQKIIDLSVLTWFPIVIFSTLVFLAGQGATTLPYVIVGEIFDQKIRAILIAFASMQSWMMNFVSIMAFPYLILFLGIYGAMWTYAIVLITFSTIVSMILPETKGKSIENIIRTLEGLKN